MTTPIITPENDGEDCNDFKLDTSRCVSVWIEVGPFVVRIVPACNRRGGPDDKQDAVRVEIFEDQKEMEDPLAETFATLP